MLKKLSIIFILLLTSPAFAADNPRLIGYPEGRIMGFKGLDTRSKAPNLEDGRAVDLLNVNLSGAFDLRKRYGYSVINDTLDDFDISSPAITGIFDAEYSNTVSWTLAFVGSKLKYDNSGTWTTVNGTATITTGQNYQWACAMALDYAVCSNDQDAPLKVSSTPTKSAVNFTGLSNAVTKAKALVWYRNYLIWGNTYEDSTERPTRFRWSDVGTIETYQDDNYIDIASFNGDEIQAFVEMYGELYIIMRKSIWKASLVGGDDVFVVVKLIDGIGTIAKGSVRLIVFPENKQGIAFLSEDKKVYLFNGVTVLDMGYLIQPTLNDLSASRLQYATSIFDGDNYYLSATTSSLSVNDIVYVFNVYINEWTKYDQIDANAFARVKESTSAIKTYFGNYKSFVYWLNDPDQVNDVDGVSGIIDSTGSITTATETGAQVLIDTTLPGGDYTGAIVRITSGTGEGEEGVVLTHTSTSLIVAADLTTTPDSSSNYSIGSINAYYQTKWYNMGDSSRKKVFRGLYFWAKEDSGDEVTVSYAEDFGTRLGSETKNLAPSSSSLWDTALWDHGVWETTGDKFYNVKLKGTGRVIQLKFRQDGTDKDFHLYGFHLLADALDRE